VNSRACDVGNTACNINQQICWRSVAHYGASSEGEPGFSGRWSELIMPGSWVRVPPLLLTTQPLGRQRSRLLIGSTGCGTKACSRKLNARLGRKSTPPKERPSAGTRGSHRAPADGQGSLRYATLTYSISTEPRADGSCSRSAELMCCIAVASPLSTALAGRADQFGGRLTAA
jgi:hypothetical protein